MKILITGYTGYIGSHILNFLTRKKEFSKIICLGRKRPFKSKKIKFLKRNLNKLFLIKEKEIDIILHIAGANEVISKDENLAYQNTFIITQNLIKSLKKTKINKFIYFSTAQVYGNNNIINEKNSTNSGNFYATTHEMSELLIKFYTKNNIKNSTIIRPFNVFGLADTREVKRDTLVPTCFIKSLKEKNYIELLSNGKQYRDFISLNEINKKIYKIFYNSKFDNKIVNLCCGTSFKILDIAKISLKVFNKHSKYKGFIKINNKDKKKYKKLKASSVFFKKMNIKTLKNELKNEIEKILLAI